MNPQLRWKLQQATKAGARTRKARHAKVAKQLRNGLRSCDSIRIGQQRCVIKVGDETVELNPAQSERLVRVAASMVEATAAGDSEKILLFLEGV